MLEHFQPVPAHNQKERPTHLARIRVGVILLSRNPLSGAARCHFFSAWNRHRPPSNTTKTLSHRAYLSFRPARDPYVACLTQFAHCFHLNKLFPFTKSARPFIASAAFYNKFFGYYHPADTQFPLTQDGVWGWGGTSCSSGRPWFPFFSGLLTRARLLYTHLSYPFSRAHQVLELKGLNGAY